MSEEKHTHVHVLEDLFVLERSRTVILVDFDDAVVTFFLCFQDFQCFIGKSRSDDTVRNLAFDQGCGVFVADIRKCDKVAERRHTVCASGSCISAC